MKSIFYQPVRESCKNHQALFWGCPHFNHDPKWDIPLWMMRGFHSSEEHDNAIVNRWNEKASRETIGFLLGDIVFGYGADEKLKRFLERISFKKLYLMPGNHQAGWKQVFEEVPENKYQTQHGGEVIFVPNYIEAYVNGQPIVMSHYPILSWNGQGKGSWMLFSHVHGSLSNSELGRMYLSKGFNKELSVEVCPHPATFGEIKQEMASRPPFSPDHHGEKGSTPFS